ncbi:MAG: hypothetical protein JXR88_17920 [Clostridia bacterium]|nr:hypothetical protein [Clostridia bacterium]
MNKSIRLLMLVLVTLWVILPDPIPGPIDDILLIMMTYASSKKQKRIS